jgi:hypothetical protein
MELRCFREEKCIMYPSNLLKVLILGVFLTVAGCATGYYPAGWDGGYADLQVASGVFRVSFQGNYYTSGDQVRDMALLRAADIAIQNGAPYFQVMPVSSPPNPSFPYVVEGYRATLTIRLMPIPPDPGSEGYDAAMLRDQLRKKYGIQ